MNDRWYSTVYIQDGIVHTTVDAEEEGDPSFPDRFLMIFAYFISRKKCHTVYRTIICPLCENDLVKWDHPRIKLPYKQIIFHKCTHGTKMILLFGITKNTLVTNRIVFVGYV
jgi:hypothetical protein